MYEEPDLCLRVWDAGFRVLQWNDLTVWHEYSGLNRNELKVHRRHARNEALSVLMRYPWPLAGPAALGKLAGQCRYAFSRGPGWAVREPRVWAEVLALLPRAFGARRGVSSRAVKIAVAVNRAPVADPAAAWRLGDLPWRDVLAGRLDAALALHPAGPANPAAAANPAPPAEGRRVSVSPDNPELRPAGRAAGGHGAGRRADLHLPPRRRRPRGRAAGPVRHEYLVRPGPVPRPAVGGVAAGGPLPPPSDAAGTGRGAGRPPAAPGTAGGAGPRGVRDQPAGAGADAPPGRRVRPVRGPPPRRRRRPVLGVPGRLPAQPPRDPVRRGPGGGGVHHGPRHRRRPASSGRKRSGTRSGPRPSPTSTSRTGTGNVWKPNRTPRTCAWRRVRSRCGR